MASPDQQKLTPEQQKLVEDSAKWVPYFVKMFLKNMPCLRSAAQLCDLESAAYLACCRAAKTFDPAKGNASAYFSIAIKNGMLQEIQREMRTGSTSVYRISPVEAERRMKATSSRIEPVMKAMLTLTEEERARIEEFVFEKGSFNSFGRQDGCNPKRAKRIFMASIAKLRRAIDDTP